jgi:hypothetical protein
MVPGNGRNGQFIEFEAVAVLRSRLAAIDLFKGVFSYRALVRGVSEQAVSSVSQSLFTVYGFFCFNFFELKLFVGVSKIMFLVYVA